MLTAVKLSPGKRVLYLTKDLELIKKQLYEGLQLKMKDVDPGDLLDDINTDVMTPAWVCFNHLPEDIAVHAYAGLLLGGERVFKERSLIDGNFEVIVSGQRKGTGSSRETAAQCEYFSGVRLVIAGSFAPIHERNNINLGQLMGDYDLLKRLEEGESINVSEFISKYDLPTQQIVKSGGLFKFTNLVMSKQIPLPANATMRRPMTMAEKIIASKSINKVEYVKPGDTVFTKVDAGYSHEFTSAQVHTFLKNNYGKNYQIKRPEKFAVFEDHLIYAKGVAKMEPFSGKIDKLCELQREFQKQTGVLDYSAKKGISPGICHEVARQEMIEPGDMVQATDSHTCMGGCLNALSYGVGATEYAALIYSNMTLTSVPESIRFELVGRLSPNVTAKDVMLCILKNYVRNGKTLNRVMEFGGPGLKSLNIDERATLCNMATECAAKSGICEGDSELIRFMVENRGGKPERFSNSFVMPDSDAIYAGGVIEIDLSSIKPMVAHPGDPDKGIASDPTNGLEVSELDKVPIDIAYGGSCTAGKYEDIAFYARVVSLALESNLKVAKGVRFYIQFGSEKVAKWSKEKGFTELFLKAGVQVLNPGCGACIGCGPGVSEDKSQVTISAINRNFQGRSGPGKLYLASPLTVAASAFTGNITAFNERLFVK